MDKAVYVLCFLASAAVAFMLLRAYVRTRTRILLWSGLGFVGLCLNNLMLVCDQIFFPNIDLSIARNVPALAGMMLLLYGLIWDTE